MTDQNERDLLEELAERIERVRTLIHSPWTGAATRQSLRSLLTQLEEKYHSLTAELDIAAEMNRPSSSPSECPPEWFDPDRPAG